MMGGSFTLPLNKQLRHLLTKNLQIKFKPGQDNYSSQPNIYLVLMEIGLLS